MLLKYKLPVKYQKYCAQLRSKYEKIVAVSSQWVIEDELIEIIKKTAAICKKTLFIFVPRYVLDKNYQLMAFPTNVVLIRQLDIYQTILLSDFHVTVYSTTALEAPVFGVRNILIDIKGQASEFYKNILSNPLVTRFVNTAEELAEAIVNWEPVPKTKIKQLHGGFYRSNHEENLKKALITIFKEKKTY
jgi:hypothetical protein